MNIYGLIYLYIFIKNIYYKILLSSILVALFIFPNSLRLSSAYYCTKYLVIGIKKSIVLAFRGFNSPTLWEAGRALVWARF